MFRNQYDNDVTVFSPQGRLFQVEYATEAVKQGAPAVGIANSRNAVLVALKRSPGDLSASATKKIISIAPHVGVAIAGLTSDARVLTRAMQKRALEEELGLERNVPVSRLVQEVVGERAQQCTQYYGGRPLGVGLLVTGVDATGAHLYEFSPVGCCTEYWGMAIGARSQSAKTWLEAKCVLTGDGVDVEEVEENPFEGLERDALITSALIALRECLPPDQSLSAPTVSIGHVAIGSDFVILSEEDTANYLGLLPPQPPRPTRAAVEPSEQITVDL